MVVEPVIMSDGFAYGESRTQPFMVWLQFLNFAMVSALCWIFLKLYRGFLSLCEWMFPFRCGRFDNPVVVMVIGARNDLNDEIVRQLAHLFRSRVIRLKDDNDNVDAASDIVHESSKESRLIYTQIPGNSQEAITKTSTSIRRAFGEVDLLVICQSEEEGAGDTESDHIGFLSNLNKQLLTQFWTVMAFLPGMLQRNHGQIVSIALGRTSSLTNSGIVRGVCEEVLLSDTNVRIKLVEKNPILEDYLPTLPSDLLASLIVRSIWTSSTFVHVPTLPQYLLMVPILIARTILHLVLRTPIIKPGR